ncbi:catechol 1,2-dioxygenase [Streptomyces sp. NPDC026673]|uniref:dioxygenase family protein n=1 Tax=Streptomyces sp. NPDC026673 TaxID=3155724 RepID=UPI0033C5CC5C
MTDDRVIDVVEDLERTLLDFMRKHHITHDEYRRARDLVISSVKEGEESLLLDVFLEAEATDIGNLGRPGSAEAIEGPFYRPGAPRLSRPYRMPQRPDEAGRVLVFHGRVTDTGNRPLAGAELDMWQADATGRYSNVFPGIPEWNLRGRLTTSEDGSFAVETILPPPYEIPKHGPMGTLLGALGRHSYRPAHLHVKVRHTGHRDLTSQLYFRGGPYLESDVANAVRDGFILDLVRHDPPPGANSGGPHGPWVDAHHDFVLAPLAAAAADHAGGALPRPS